MTRAALESAESHRIRREVRAVTDDSILKRDSDSETAIAVAKLNRARDTRAKQYISWDGLVSSPEFAAYLKERGWMIQECFRPMPYDTDAELSCLGAMLIDESVVEKAIPPLRPEHFRHPDTANVLIAIQSLKRRQRKGQFAPIDIVTVSSEMRRLQTYNERTGAVLKAAMEGCPSAANIAAYVEVVMYPARCRSLSQLGAKLREVSLEPDVEPQQIINTTRCALDSIEARGVANIKEIFEDSK